MADHTEPCLVRSDFATSDQDAAEDLFRQAYLDTKLVIAGGRAGFTLDHSMIGGPGFSMNRLRIGIDMFAEAESGPDDPFTVVQPMSGRLRYVDHAYSDTYAEAGDVVISPPTGSLRAICERFDLALIPLDRRAVAAYAGAMTGIEPDQVAFHDIAPVTPAMARHLASTAALVRGVWLADQGIAAQPIVLDQAFRSLANAMLATFPNTALDRATDPERPAPHGDVSAATLRQVLDYLDTHADQPVGPTDIAELAGMPVNQIIEGLRRRRGVHPAELLWQARLRGVRRDLLDADPQSGVSVAELVARWGFARVGPFRVAFARQFGEDPEHTLRR